MEFNVGEKYKVTGDYLEKGNVIEITNIVRNTIYYKTVKGESVLFNRFGKNSLFAKSLKPIKENGCIVIYKKDNEVIALDKSTGEKAVAKCSPEDTFDFITGAKLAFERLTTDPLFYPEDEKIKVGDTVAVVDKDYSFTSNTNFFKNNNIDIDIAARYKYGELPDNGSVYKVLAVGELKLYKEKGVVIANGCRECYLISEKGLKKC